MDKTKNKRNMQHKCLLASIKSGNSHTQIHTHTHTRKSSSLKIQ